MIITRKNILVSGAALAGLLAPTIAQAQHRKFNIPAQPATRSVPEFARQAGVQIVASGKALRGTTTRPLKGEYEVREALDLLLRGAGVKVVASEGRIITLGPIAQTPTAPSPNSPGPAQVGEASRDGAITIPSGAEIVVTALKRGETTLEAPATITLLQSKDIAAKNIVSSNQLSGIVPGLVQAPGVGGLPATTFRGLGSNSSVFNLEPSVALYYDGAYMPHVRDYVAPLYDIDHIEFIKGTQSTLLAKNTSLGAINIVNNRPRKTFGYDLEYVHSFETNGNRIQGALNVPMSDTLQLRGALLASRDHGWVRNTYKDRTEPRQTEVSGRVSFGWQPIEDLSVYGTYQHDIRRGRGQLLEALNDPRGVIAARAAAIGILFDPDTKNISVSASDALGGTVAGAEAFDRQNTDRINLVSDYQIGEHTLTTQTNYTVWRSPRHTDLDFTAANLFNLTDNERSRTFSQEVRLASPSGGRLGYLLGAYYFYNSWRYGRIFFGSPNTIGFPLAGSSVGETWIGTRAFSGFASVTAEVIEGLKLEAGARYTHERKRGTFVRNTSGGAGFVSSFPTIPFSAYPTKVANPLDYNLGARYEPSSRVLLYATYSKGSKSGSFQDSPVTLATGPFSSETAYSAEAGAKIRLDRGYLIGAVFNTDVKDFQTSFSSIVNGISLPTVLNSNIRSRGAEAALSYELVPGLSLGASVTYANAVFTEDFPNTPGERAAIARKGDRLTRNPEWSGFGSVDYQTEIGGGLQAFVGGRIDFASEALLQFVVPRPDAPVTAAYTTLDMQIGLRGSDSGWEVTLSGTNIFNERFIEFGAPITVGGGAYYGAYNRPRVIALSFRVKQ